MLRLSSNESGAILDGKKLSWMMRNEVKEMGKRGQME